MIRHLLIAIALTVAAAGTAYAQVAAPLLNPVHLFTAMPTNPATLSWDVPSRVGLNYGRVTFEDVVPATESDTFGLQAQYSGQTFAFGITHESFDIDAGAGAIVEQSFTTLAGSARIGEWFTLGLSQESSTYADPSPSSSDETAYLLGAVARIGTVFFIGAAFGSGDISGTSGSGSRDWTRYALAYNSIDKSGGLHVEIGSERKQRLATIEDGASNNYASVEVRFGSFLIGYLTQSRETIDNATGLVSANADLDTWELSYVPMEGLAIGYANLALSGTGTGPQSLKVQSIGVSWLY